VHDFPDRQLGRSIPDGIYDVSANTGWVSVGTDHDSSAFAVATLRSWWDTLGRTCYPAADRLLICADGGGSNGSRVRAWKIELAAFAAATGLHVTVCHLPPGTSKWNQIEHRLFSQSTMNWRGRPLKTHQVIVDLISSTITTTGPTVRRTLDTREYTPSETPTPKPMSARSHSSGTTPTANGTTACSQPTHRQTPKLFRREPLAEHRRGWAQRQEAGISEASWSAQAGALDRLLDSGNSHAARDNGRPVASKIWRGTSEAQPAGRLAAAAMQVSAEHGEAAGLASMRAAYDRVLSRAA
jgi:hypothetical protein